MPLKVQVDRPSLAWRLVVVLGHLRASSLLKYQYLKKQIVLFTTHLDVELVAEHLCLLLSEVQRVEHWH
jgi:hypothetical protein